jgi:molybdenum cofactor guanylyltransferase
MVRNISGVILAGGTGKRFNGILKSKILINGKPVISKIIETIDDIFEEIIIVTNTPEEFKEFYNCKIVGDQFLDKGPLSGIHSALKKSDKEAIFVLAGDMPLLDKKIILKQIEFYNRNKGDAVIPQIDQYIEPLHGIYKRTLLRILEVYLNGKNDYAVHEFLKITDVHYLKLEGSEEIKNAFTNINSPVDVNFVKKIL